MVSSRASEVAELLWELKRAQKVATYTTLAKQAGFSAGMNGRTMATTIRTIRRDWPHLEWWRAVSDDGVLEKDSEHEEKLRQSGYELEEAKGKRGALMIKALDKHLMIWEAASAASASAAAAAE
jgi:alkylated DNA nucleotide flippase Atl1